MALTELINELKSVRKGQYSPLNLLVGGTLPKETSFKTYHEASKQGHQHNHT